MRSILTFIIIVVGFTAKAQISTASLQASGLTCSMCSRAVQNALEEITFVDKVVVDLNKQEYTMQFKPNLNVDLDALSKAVEDAGFSIARLKITADVNNIKVKKDEHVQIGKHYFHFLNAANQQLNGASTFTLVDKSFLSAKEYKKWSNASKMECVKTGRAATCCPAESNKAQSRIYHAII